MRESAHSDHVDGFAQLKNLPAQNYLLARVITKLWRKAHTGDTIKGTDHSVFFLSSITVASNRLIHNKVSPNILEYYCKSFARAKATLADILLSRHPPFINHDEKYEAQKNGKTDAFVNSNELKEFVARAEGAFEVELEKQQAMKK